MSMVHTIPTVGRVAGNGRWVSSAVVHLIASVLAGMSFGVLLGLMGSPLTLFIDQHVLGIALALFMVLLGLAELGAVSLPRPQLDKQVPARWRGRFSPETTALLYGAIIGVGVLTKISFASFYALLAWAALSGDALGAGLMFATFGVGRAALPVLLSPFLRDRESSSGVTASLVPFHRMLTRITGLVLLLLGFSLAVEASVLGSL